MDQSSSSCSSTSHCLPSLPSKASMSGRLVHVDFPEVPVSLLESLNQQRLEGQLCDLSIQVQGQEFRAHRCVLAASSPYFHDQVLLKNVSSVVLPSVMDPLAFESVLGSAYTGRLSMLRDELINYVTVGSFLQMWHVVDKCTELLREGRGLLQSSQPPSNEQQSPSSTNYCSPPEGAGEAASQQQQQQGHLYSSGSAGHPNKYSRGDARESGQSPPQDSDVIAGSPPSSDQQRWLVGRPSSSIRSLALPLQRSQEESEPDETQSFQSQYHRSRIRHAQTHQNPLGLHLSPYEPGLHPSSSSAPPSSPSPGPADQVPFCESSQDFVSTYDEIEEGTGQVSQRPLLAPPLLREQQEGGGFPAVAGTPPLAGAPYTGKVHLCHCGKAYTLKSMRDRHVKMQHLNLRPFACPVCAKTFKMKHHLTKHLKTHAGLQPFECQLCGKKLMWRDSFLRHRSHCERLAAEEIAASTAGVKEEEEEEGGPGAGIPAEGEGGG
ncbi:zinc finger and BTB domain-containing protein 22-like [Acipenser oxyrinchus oxyrinchus]|uniref:Zinc finger and BTB domain-containing protein 22-like n=1 Tax=Acipenser oxyrinchus oxyrinchus TaxID=40147 RepID=A0AAD8FTC4_ACIOX|nr:zinc finger and BTB domain-containing protein 22-like [Acipenser oxyrinchus oxyrinchus]